MRAVSGLREPARGADPNGQAAEELSLHHASWIVPRSPEHPNSSFSSPAADYVGVATLLVAAGARVEPKFRPPRSR